MRLNRVNTLIEDNSYPLEGMHENDICDYFVSVFKPYESIIKQFESALLLHNVPLYITIIIVCGIFVTSFKVVVESEFPTIIFIICLYPSINLLLLVGGRNMLSSICIEIPDLPEGSPNRVLNVEELVKVSWKLLTFLWRIGFFVYRTFVCPNIIDIIVFLFAVIVFGLLLCVLDGLFIFTVVLCILLFFPPLLTREVVYSFLMAHLGHPLPEKEFNDQTYMKSKSE